MRSLGRGFTDGEPHQVRSEVRPKPQQRPGAVNQRDAARRCGSVAHAAPALRRAAVPSEHSAQRRCHALLCSNLCRELQPQRRRLCLRAAGAGARPLRRPTNAWRA